MGNTLDTMNVWLSQHAFVMSMVLLWSLAWKGLALWKAARKSDKWWFVALLVINLLGILEILYYFVFSERKGAKEKDETI